MLVEHLDESHGAASRNSKERSLVLDWLWKQLPLKSGTRILDITCGPGLYAVELARRGCLVTGIDFSPASIKYARALAQKTGVADRCNILEGDVREIDFGEAEFDVALFLYGQLAVFPREEAHQLLEKAAQALRPGGRLLVELLDQNGIDKKHNTWWYTDDTGLWGDAPYLHLGERFWLDEEKIAIERFTILHLNSGQLDEIILCDQSYSLKAMAGLMKQAGFGFVETYPGWSGLPLNDAKEWVLYLAQRSDN
jgi:SAM-dependent methyltransferase